MKRPTLLYNIGIAIIMTGVALVAIFVLRHLLSIQKVPAFTVAFLAISYISHLLSRSDRQVGRIILGFICLTVLIIAIFLKVELASLLLLAMGLIWVARSLLYYSSVLPALTDLGLCGVSFITAIWGYFTSGSAVVAVWCFFLTQALSALIPKRFNHTPSTETKSGHDRFNQAYQSAETAIRHLARK